ncbi:MAG: hypothetical protein J6J93_07195, partial [Muribaculaceae bacterium]|nr:hypothetical protein [Muribaculaceae bacterium]
PGCEAPGHGCSSVPRQAPEEAQSRTAIAKGLCWRVTSRRVLRGSARMGEEDEFPQLSQRVVKIPPLRGSPSPRTATAKPSGA